MIRGTDSRIDPASVAPPGAALGQLHDLHLQLEGAIDDLLRGRSEDFEAVFEAMERSTRAYREFLSDVKNGPAARCRGVGDRPVGGALPPHLTDRRRGGASES